jgi:EF-hand domain-containing protein 1
VRRLQTWCSDNGVTLGDNIGVPRDSYSTLRESLKARDTGSDPTGYYGKKANPMKRFMEASLGNPSAVQIRGIKDSKKKFLDYDRVVLRFFALWDNTTSVYGDKLKLVINYYMADDTVEVIEVQEPNCGRQKFGPMLKRQPLPRSVLLTDDRSRGIEDDNGEGDYYSYEDFEVGKTINLLGRPVLLYDADT